MDFLKDTWRYQYILHQKIREIIVTKFQATPYWLVVTIVTVLCGTAGLYVWYGIESMEENLVSGFWEILGALLIIYILSRVAAPVYLLREKEFLVAKKDLTIKKLTEEINALKQPIETDLLARDRRDLLARKLTALDRSQREVLRQLCIRGKMLDQEGRKHLQDCGFNLEAGEIFRPIEKNTGLLERDGVGYYKIKDVFQHEVWKILSQDAL